MSAFASGTIGVRRPFAIQLFHPTRSRPVAPRFRCLWVRAWSLEEYLPSPAWKGHGYRHVFFRKREAQFKILQDAQAEVLNLTAWHQFLSALIGAGFRSGEMISSQSALLYGYSFYLIGRNIFEVQEHAAKLIGRWFFFSSLTGRYTSSPETVMDSDLNRLKGIKKYDEFIDSSMA